LVVTRVYRPSDMQAVKKKEELKKKLGVPSDPRKWSHQDMIKVDRYFRIIGWDMSMSGCNPESFFWNREPVTNKALCMLYNELMIARAEESLRSAKGDLSRFGMIYKRQYEEVKRKVQSRTEKLAKYNEVIKVEVEKNTGIKTVPKPQPRPSTVVRRITATSTAVEVHEPEQKKPPDWVLPVAVLGGIYLARRLIR